MTGDPEPERVARRFVDAFVANDLEMLRTLLAGEFVGHVTTADGGTRDLDPDDYVSAIARMDVSTADLRLDVRNATAIGNDTVLLMVEVHAERRGRRLHNFSGQLVTVRDGLVAELWMVDALPAESDNFWSS